MLEQNNKVKQVIDASVNQVDSIIQADKIIGERIVNEKGQSVIPVSKLTNAVIGGGGEYGEIKLSEKLGKNFAGGSITLTSIKPECFIIDNGNGFEIASAKDSLDSLLSAILRVVNSLKHG